MAGTIDPTPTRASRASRAACAATLLVVLLCLAPQVGAAALELPLRVRASVAGIVVDTDVQGGGLLREEQAPAAPARQAPSAPDDGASTAAPAETGGGAEGRPAEPTEAAWPASGALAAWAWPLKAAIVLVAGLLFAVAAPAARRNGVRALLVVAVLAVGVLDLALTGAAFAEGRPGGVAWLAATALAWGLLVAAARRLSAPEARAAARLERALDTAHLEATALRVERLAARNRALHAEVDATRRARLALQDDGGS